jgi:YaiO family outer membrane protein
MQARHHRNPIAVLALGMALAGPSAMAFEVEIGAQHGNLSDGFAAENLQWLRVGWRGPSDRLLQVSVEAKQAFGEHATMLIGSLAQDVSPDDRLGFALAASDAKTIAAEWRADAYYSRKLLPERNLVATVAGYAANVADGHRDRGLVGSLAWYFADRQVAEAGVRMTRSSPGQLIGWRGFAAYTWGTVGADALGLRAESGRETYQSLGSGGELVDFQSYEVGLAWRHWLTPGAGLVLNLAHYKNPSYRRDTLGAAAFAAF